MGAPNASHRHCRLLGRVHVATSMHREVVAEGHRTVPEGHGARLRRLPNRAWTDERGQRPAPIPSPRAASNGWAVGSPSRPWTNGRAPSAPPWGPIAHATRSGEWLKG